MNAWQLSDESLLDMNMQDAAEIFLETRKPFLSPRTHYGTTAACSRIGGKSASKIPPMTPKRITSPNCR